MKKLNKLFNRKDKPKKLKRRVEKDCWKLLGFIRAAGLISGDQLASLMYMPAVQVRKLIRLIRERNHIFFNPSNTLYIIASPKGYFLSNDINKQSQYANKLKGHIKSKTYQLEELEAAMEANYE